MVARLTVVMAATMVLWAIGAEATDEGAIGAKQQYVVDSCKALLNDKSYILATWEDEKGKIITEISSIRGSERSIHRLLLR